jgi:hypothetical protein
VPVAAVVPPEAGGERRTVTVEVERFHAPSDLRRGEVVDVYVTSTDSSEGRAAPELLAEAAAVVEVEDDGSRFGGTGSSRGVVVSVPREQVPRLVGGLGRGTVDIVRIPAR